MYVCIYIYMYMYVRIAISKLLSQLHKNENNTNISLH